MPKKSRRLHAAPRFRECVRVCVGIDCARPQEALREKASSSVPSYARRCSLRRTSVVATTASHGETRLLHRLEFAIPPELAR